MRPFKTKVPRAKGAKESLTRPLSLPLQRTGLTENELVLRTPLVVGPRPVVSQPQPVHEALKLEDVRIAEGSFPVRLPVRLVHRRFIEGGSLGAKEDPIANTENRTNIINTANVV